MVTFLSPHYPLGTINALVQIAVVEVEGKYLFCHTIIYLLHKLSYEKKSPRPKLYRARRVFRLIIIHCDNTYPYNTAIDIGYFIILDRQS